MPAQDFLITGATGATGGATARLLLDRGHAVRAFVHRIDARSEALAAAGAEVFVGDLEDFHDMRRATEGIDGIYLCYPVAPGLVQATACVAQAALDAGVRAVVNMSQIVASPESTSHASVNHWLAERLLDRFGLAVTHLRPTIFAEWLLYSSAYIAATGTLALPFKDGKVAMIAADDQAKVIAAILQDPGPHRGKTYPLYGPTEMTFDEVAVQMSAALGRDIRFQSLTDQEFGHFLREAGRSDFIAQHATGMALAFAKGGFAGTNDHVRTIGGHPPTSVHEFVTRHAAAFARQ